jgi:hypothetical protein
MAKVTVWLSLVWFGFGCLTSDLRFCRSLRSLSVFRLRLLQFYCTLPNLSLYSNSSWVQIGNTCFLTFDSVSIWPSTVGPSKLFHLSTGKRRVFQKLVLCFFFFFKKWATISRHLWCLEIVARMGLRTGAGQSTWVQDRGKITVRKRGVYEE